MVQPKSKGGSNAAKNTGKVGKPKNAGKKGFKPGGPKGKRNQTASRAPKKPLKLKQTLKQESKVVKASSLAWKEVEIPDNMGDYEGFFGLEEIDGVDVKIVNGKPEFIVKDKRKLKTEAQLEELERADGVFVEKKEEEKEDENKDDEESESEEEFTGFDDMERDVKEEVKEVKEGDNKKQKQQKQKKNASKKTQDEDSELKPNGFNFLDLPLPEEEVDLPAWNKEESGLVLSPYVLSGLAALKFNSPTPIQRKSIPLALQGKDIIGKATTGSGKTLAYGIPILERYISKLSEIKSNTKNKIINPPTGIIFAPTRELAHQVVDHLNKIAKYAPLSEHGIVNITGGLSIQKQERLLSHGPGIIVATPGRFLELLENDDELTKRLALTDIIVLDEADRLLQDGHFEEFDKILEILQKNRPNKDAKIAWKWQTLVFSATFSSDLFGKLDKHHKRKLDKVDLSSGLIGNTEILKLLTDKLKFKDAKPGLVDVNPKETVSGKVTEALIECGATERDLYLYYFLLMYPGSTLVFTNAIDSVKRLVPFLNNLKIPTFSIHSSMIQKQRLRAIERFKEASENSKVAVLVASDVAARGLDIPNIDHVAHYHLPRTADVYIHRSGRTGRAGKEGVSVMLCSPQEASGPLKKLRKLVANTGEQSTRFNMQNDVKSLPIEMDVIGQIKPRVNLASQLSNSTVSTTSTSKEDSWVKQAAEDLGMDDLSDIDDFEDDFLKRSRKRKEGKIISKDESKGLRYELNQLLNTPLRKNHRRSYITSGLENLAHQIVTGNTHKAILGHKDTKALDDLRRGPKNHKKSDNKVAKKKSKDDLNKISKRVSK